MESCEVCGKIEELYELGMNGEDDYYVFNVCEDCHDYFSSDTYEPEDVFSMMAQRKGE